MDYRRNPRRRRRLSLIGKRRRRHELRRALSVERQPQSLGKFTTEMILTPENDLRSSKSLSPVTRSSHPCAIAAARIGSSSGSRKPAFSLEASERSKDLMISSVTEASASSRVRPNLVTSFSRTSAQIYGVVTSLQRGDAASTTRRQSPPVVAASQTLESRRTNTRQVQDFLFRIFRRAFHQFVNAPPVNLRLAFQPLKNLTSLSGREAFQFLDDLSCTHDGNIAESFHSWKPVFG